MSKRLFLLDGMALAYRAHFAFINRPIRTSTGFETSALYGFTNTLIELLQKEKPTHMALVMDTPEPTFRHEEYPNYKGNRDEAPDGLKLALPHIPRFAEAFGLQVVQKPGYEADDIIGTLTLQADKSKAVYESFMVTPDKDFAQLVSPTTSMYKPGRGGDPAQVMGLEDILTSWEIQNPSQVIDILGLWGDASDNIPGVPGIGEKTAKKLIAQFGDVEGLLSRTAELKGKQKEKVEENAEQARLSRRLATICREVPLDIKVADLKLKEPDQEVLKELFEEFEMNTLGKRVLGADFKASAKAAVSPSSSSKESPDNTKGVAEGSDTVGELKTIADVHVDYQRIDQLPALKKLVTQLKKEEVLCFDVETTQLEVRSARLVGVALSWAKGKAAYVIMPKTLDEQRAFLEVLGKLLGLKKQVKVGHHLKYDISIMQEYGVKVEGPLFDTMLAHSLIAPDMKHGMDYLAEVYLGYTPIAFSSLFGGEVPKLKAGEELPMDMVDLDELTRYAAEDADITLQLMEKFEPLLKEHGQEKVFYEVEMPLVPVLVSMETTGICLDTKVLKEFGEELQQAIDEAGKRIHEIVGHDFNLNSPKQLGEVLFDELKLDPKAKKTKKTGQYKTNEQVLQMLAPQHEVVQKILDYRGANKLKSTYVDTLPDAVSQKTGRVHTSYQQLNTATGRLASNGPNLQNIPIRTAMGKEIRKAFVPQRGWELMSADYSQIELRVIAELSKDEGMKEAFESGMDIHQATAARIYNIMPEFVDGEMRSKAKMVNFGIPYGISAFGLSQRLGVPRYEAADLIDGYFAQFPGIRDYIEGAVNYAKENGYVETLLGRRRYLPDITSGNAPTRQAAERNAVNMPIQGTSADMIKIAMSSIHQQLLKKKMQTQMLLQVHDELVFEVPKEEKEKAAKLVVKCMVEAIPMKVPVEVGSGFGKNWLQAH